MNAPSSNELRTYAVAWESLTAGERPSSSTLDAALVAYDESMRLAIKARKAAAVAYTRSAAAHRAAGDTAQNRGDLGRAQQHRDLAATDEQVASELAETEG